MYQPLSCHAVSFASCTLDIHYIHPGISNNSKFIFTNYQKWHDIFENIFNFKPTSFLSVTAKNKTMKKVFILMSCMLLTAAIANAQKGDSLKRAKVKEKVTDTSRNINMKDGMISPENMKALDLSKDQEKQIYELHTKSKKEKEAIRNDKSLTEEQKKEKLKTIDKSYKDKSESVLTNEQKNKMKRKKDNKKGDKEPADTNK